MANLDVNEIAKRGQDTFQRMPQTVIFALVIAFFGWVVYVLVGFVSGTVNSGIEEIHTGQDDMVLKLDRLISSDELHTERWIQFRADQEEFRERVFASSIENLEGIEAQFSTLISAQSSGRDDLMIIKEQLTEVIKEMRQGSTTSVAPGPPTR